jgi:hypothetical protein
MWSTTLEDQIFFCSALQKDTWAIATWGHLPSLITSRLHFKDKLNLRKSISSSISSIQYQGQNSLQQVTTTFLRVTTCQWIFGTSAITNTLYRLLMLLITSTPNFVNFTRMKEFLTNLILKYLHVALWLWQGATIHMHMLSTWKWELTPQLM